ncbi:SDR family oxidoreductase [Virgibacillus ainsalahensis]
MKVLVIGANGQIGKHLVNILQDSAEHSVRAMVRKEEQEMELRQSGVESVLADLEGSVEEIADAAKGCDAIVFTAGSGGSTGPDKTLLVDLDGAVKSIDAAGKAGVKRYIMVSGHQAHNRENWFEELKHYYVAKHYADRTLEESGLTYTIVRPGYLQNVPGTGRISAAKNLERGSIPREDVARTIVTALGEENTFNRSFDLITGDKPIVDVLNTL